MSTAIRVPHCGGVRERQIALTPRLGMQNRSRAVLRAELRPPNEKTAGALFGDPDTPAPEMQTALGLQREAVGTVITPIG